jgi:hypothetical protein
MPSTTVNTNDSRPDRAAVLRHYQGLLAQLRAEQLIEGHDAEPYLTSEYSYRVLREVEDR